MNVAIQTPAAAAPRLTVTTAPAPTQSELYRDNVSIDTARKLFAFVAREMRLISSERAAIGHAISFFATNRARGLVVNRGLHFIEPGEFSPIVGENERDGEMAKNVIYNTLRWIACLRGQQIRRGARVLGMHNGRVFVGTVTKAKHICWDGAAGVQVRADLLDDGEMPFTFVKSRQLRRFRNIDMHEECLIVLG